MIDTNSPFRPGKSSRPVKLCVSRMRDVTHGYAPVQINGTTDWFSRSCRSTVWNKEKKKRSQKIDKTLRRMLVFECISHTTTIIGI